MMDAEQQAMEERRNPVRIGVFAGIARRRVVRQRRAIALVAGAGLLLAAGAAVGAAKLVTPTASQTAHTAACYPSDTSEPHYFGNGDEPPYDVVELCQEMWKRGVIGQTPPPTDPNDMTADFPVPDIALCLDRGGFRAGFPIWDDAETPEELCNRLGLPLLEE